VDYPEPELLPSMFTSIDNLRWLKVAGVCLVTAATVLAVRPAVAQTSTTSSVVAPRLKQDSPAAYPDQALKDGVAEPITVTLVLELDVAGGVHDATVATPRGHGFDEAALAAARGLLFEPALRNGVPVAARIKFQYRFSPPAPRLRGRVLSQADESPVATAHVVVTDASGVPHEAQTGPDGGWELADMPPGSVHISVHADRQEAQQLDESLKPGEETNIVIRLQPAVASGDESAQHKASDEEVIEVTVRGERPPREVTKRTLSKEEIDRIPGTNGDALRSLQNLPGVARSPALGGGLIVRGSNPQDTNIFVDGTSIPLVYHFMGLSSVVPTEVLQKIDFYPGNYSSIYGRGMGGIVDVGLRKPKQDGLHGMAQADFIDVRLLAEGPIAKTGWNVLVAGRRSWFDTWLGPVMKSAGAGVSVAPRYYDGQAMLQHDFNAHSSFRLLLFGSNDEMKMLNLDPNGSDPTFAGNMGYSTSFWRLQARYENQVSNGTALRLTAAYGTDSIDIGMGSNAINSTLRPLSTRAELTQKVTEGVTANLGTDLVYEPYDLTLNLPPAPRPGTPEGGPGQLAIHSSNAGSLFLPGFYTELELVPKSGTRVVPGFRADYDNATHHWDYSPRINVRQDLKSDFPRTTFKAGAGLYYQPPTVMQTDPNYGQLGLISNRSIHYDVGFEQEFTRQLELSMDVFYKSFDNLVVSGTGNSGDGLAYGVEWLLRYKPDKHFFGWISYTLSRSERRDTPSNSYRLFQYDQTHVLTMVSSYKLGRGWQLGGRFRLTSGALYTPSTTGAYNATVGSQLAASAYPAYGSRLPLFHQLDVRADKTWEFQSWKLSAYLDVQNVYYRKNAEGISYNYNYTQSAIVSGLPILPSLGVRAEF
jgi:TonB family protein